MMVEAEVGVRQQKVRQGPPWIAERKWQARYFQRDHGPAYILIWGFQALDLCYNTFLLF